MALSPTGPLERATAAARAAEPDDWESVSSSVKRRVRATVAPSRPVVVVSVDGTTDQDEHGSRTHVASRVVRSRLREELGSNPVSTPERIDLVIGDDERLARVEIDVVCAYGAELLVVVEDVRRLAEDVVTDLLGAGTRPPVDVTVTDVVVGDVRLA